MPARDPETALIVVDVQNDFCPGGALGVPRGDALADRIEEAAASAGTVVATRDAHPADHISFAERGGAWPPHCVAGTPGAELHPSVAGMAFDRVQDKGTDPDHEAYSGFQGTPLADWLRDRGVKRVRVAGIASDYCVRATALDALGEGFDTTVLTDAIAPVEVEPGDEARALAEIAAAGGHLDRVRLLRDERDLAPLLDAKAERLRALLAETGRSGIVIGLSGGIDSAVAMAVAARALGPERIVAVRLPSRHTEQVHLDDAASAAAAAGLPAENLLTVSIEPILAGVTEARPSIAGADARFGNAAARARMVVLYDLAFERGGLVLGTENRSEALLGYFTRFGDAASDVEPIHDLYKLEVRAAARALGQPEPLIAKHPTAGLWGGQTDEDELGFSYDDADPALVCFEDLGMGVEETARRTGLPAETVRRVADRVASQRWKGVVPHVV